MDSGEPPAWRAAAEERARLLLDPSQARLPGPVEGALERGALRDAVAAARELAYL